MLFFLGWNVTSFGKQNSFSLTHNLTTQHNPASHSEPNPQTLGGGLTNFYLAGATPGNTPCFWTVTYDSNPTPPTLSMTGEFGGPGQWPSNVNVTGVTSPVVAANKVILVGTTQGAQG